MQVHLLEVLRATVNDQVIEILAAEMRVSNCVRSSPACENQRPDYRNPRRQDACFRLRPLEVLHAKVNDPIVESLAANMRVSNCVSLKACMQKSTT